MPELPTEMRVPGRSLPERTTRGVAAVRDAATVALLADGSPASQAGPQVFVLQRTAGMDFAGGMTVFPGGGVDARDGEAGGDLSTAWSGPEPAWWARRLGCDAALARALVCAAVRETFEECGVLLAAPVGNTDGLVADAGHYHRARAALAAGETSLARFLAEHELVLRADLLRPWSRWITPAEEPRRYDARFFVTALPPGQRADGATSEATAAGWHPPREILDASDAGRVGLLPPTRATLLELDRCRGVADALAAPRTIEPITPQLVQDADGLRVLLPGHPDYQRPGVAGQA